MCEDADAVVLGRMVEEDEAIVELWLLKPPESGPAPTKIQIDKLSAHSLKTYRFEAGLSAPRKRASRNDSVCGFRKRLARDGARCLPSHGR